ncbi:MAG: TolC family protein [Verrucomicrobiales bacterium]|nr:TolC family protein [Verrucomicrobiales bacterium]
MNYTNFALIWVTMTVTLGSLPTSAKSQTLREAVCHMLEFEPELNAAEYDTLSSREDQKLSRSGLFPRLSLNSSAGVTERDRSTDGLFESGESLFQRQVGLSIRQLLYDGGTTVNQARSSRNAFLAQQYLEKSMIEERVVDLAEVYLEVIRTERQIDLAELNVRNHERMRDMLEERARAGGARSDLSLVQGRLGLATNTLATSKLALRLARNRFERLTGVIPRNLTVPEIPGVPSVMDSVDLSNNFSYLASAEALEAAQFRARASEGLDRPRIYLDGGASVGRDLGGVRGEDNEVSGLVVASWDLFSGGYNKAAKEKEHYQVGKYEELLRTADLERHYNLGVLWQEREGSLASVDALGVYARELNMVTDDYREQFKVGRQELLNILDVQSEYYTAKSRLLDANFDLDTSSYRILGVQGLATSFILGGDGCEGCGLDDKSVVDPKSETATFTYSDPDARVPLTQGHLMNGRFDTAGPEADYASLEQEYYVEQNQLPVQPSADAKPKGGVFKFFRMTPPQNSRIRIFK